MYHRPAHVDPLVVAYEKILLELPTQWKQYDFPAMSDAERNAAALLVKCAAAELKIRCKVEAPGFRQKFKAIAVVSGDYMNRKTTGQSLFTEILSAVRCVKEWDKVRMLFHGHKLALRITTYGENARNNYYAGDPDALWNFIPIVPGRVCLEKIKVEGCEDASICTNRGLQAIATASVGDINVNVYPTAIVPESSTKTSSKGQTAKTVIEPLFSVPHWSELTIGVDEHWRYWAMTPPVQTGEKFKKQDALEILLPGDRWKVLLKLLAESESGNCCETETLFRELGYLSPPSPLPRENRARPGSIDSSIKSELPQQYSAALKSLKDALKDLARKLREQVGGPKGRGQEAALKINGKKVQSGYFVGFLIPDKTGHLFFRELPS